jgi:hypothetical protein
VRGSSGPGDTSSGIVKKSGGTKLVQDNIIEIDGVRVGLNICLDHRLGLLWESIQSTGQALVDVQLITSAGMAIELGPNPFKPGGGVVYLTDGKASSAACVRTDTTEPLTRKLSVESRGRVVSSMFPWQVRGGYPNSSHSRGVLTF